MPGENFVEPGVVVLAIGMAALLVRAPRAPARAWKVAAVLVALAWLIGGVPIYDNPCPLCGNGWSVDTVAFGCAGLASAGFLWIARRIELRPTFQFLVAAEIAWTIMRAGTFAWFS